MSLEEKHPIYTVGGTVQAGGGFYLSRQADEELLNLCRQNVFAYILTARQVGKSSLMVRTAQRLKQEGACPVIIDLTNIGVQVTPEQWYFGLLDEIKEPLTPDIDLAKWWREHAQFGFTQRLCRAMVDARHLRWTEADVDRVVADTFFGAMSEQDNNLQFVRDMLTKRAPDVEGALTTYREIRAGNPMRDEEQSLVKSHLKLSGVVRRERAELRMRNSIYAAVFDERWIKQHLRIDLVKRVKRVSVKLAPYVAAALVILSLFAWWNVWTLRMKAAEAESRTREAEAAYKSALLALTQAEEKTAELNEEARIAKDEAQTAKAEAARLQVMARKAVEEASRQLMIARQAKDEVKKPGRKPMPGKFSVSMQAL